MDLLAQVLAVAGVRGTVAAQVEAGTDWSWWNTDLPGAAVHAVTAGTAWLGLPGASPVQLLPGDVALLPTGVDHSMASHGRPVAPGRTASTPDRSGGDVVRIGSGPTTTHIFCAHYRHDPAVTTRVLDALPSLVHLRADHAGGRLDSTVRLLAQELSARELASDVVLDRLVDVLLIQVLRTWIADVSPGAGTWLGVLGDPLMTDALGLLHGDPARPWTADLLAARLAVSRATLARRFRAVLGESPGAYLTRWRMDVAAVRLRDTGDFLDAIARAVGYTSTFAFSRAFSRTRGEAPSRYRLLARDGLAPRVTPRPSIPR